MEATDAQGDDYGPGSYVYPINAVFKAGDFDLQHIRISKDNNNVYFNVQFGNIDNPFGGPPGISKRLLDIYIDKDGTTGSGNEWTKDLNTKFTAEAA